MSTQVRCLVVVCPQSNALCLQRPWEQERTAEFEELTTEYDSILMDCEHFSLEKPDLRIVDAMRVELQSAADLWMLFDQFSQGLETHVAEDWIVFRSHMYDFSDFLDTWVGTLKTHPPSVVTVRIRKDVDRFQELIPLLKYLRGDAYSAEHWGELFRLITIDPKVTMETLTFRHFIDVTDTILESADEIRALNARAQGEISIREALNELDMWGANQVRNDTPYGHVCVWLLCEWYHGSCTDNVAPKRDAFARYCDLRRSRHSATWLNRAGHSNRFQ